MVFNHARPVFLILPTVTKVLKVTFCKSSVVRRAALPIVNSQARVFAFVRKGKIEPIYPKISGQNITNCVPITIVSQQFQNVTGLNQRRKNIKNFCLGKYHLPNQFGGEMIWKINRQM